MYGGEVGGLQYGWVERMKTWLATERPGSVVHNMSVSGGYGTFQAMPTGTMNPAGKPAPDTTHNITAALALSPDAIIVGYQYPNDTPAETIANLAVIRDAANAGGAMLWVATPHPVKNTQPAKLTMWLQLNADIQAAYPTRWIDFWTPMAAPNGDALDATILGDDAHPSKEGHLLLFEEVVAANVPAIALGEMP